MMVRAKPVLAKGEFYAIRFDCPGCRGPHVVRVRGEHAWGWNDSFEHPTITPSILCRWNEGQTPKVCHSFVRDGRIEFLSDCTHDKAGQTLDLPEITSNW